MSKIKEFRLIKSSTSLFIKSIIVLGIVSVNSLAHAELLAETDDYRIDIVSAGLSQPWATTHLDNGDILISERAGALRLIRNGSLIASPIKGVPEVYYAGQGGLLDVQLDANFNTNKIIYLSYAIGTIKANAIRLASAKLLSHNASYALEDIKPIFTASPLKRAPQHYAGRIAQLADNTLLLAVGDGYDYREHAQKLDSHLGKIIRIKPDGSVPADNPFIDTSQAKPEIWSYGHRNHQALTVVDGEVYQHEHGPQGGDEVNLIKPGRNYGWPIASKGRDYNGARISPFDQYPNTEAPLVDWTPSIAPSSMAYANGNLYVTALAEQSIRMLSIDGQQVTDLGKVFAEIKGRLRDISVGIDGNLYVLSDGLDAKLIRIRLASNKENQPSSK